MPHPSTGLRPIDDLFGGLRVGDNVVWDVGEDSTVEPFVSAFLRASGKAPGVVYVSFHVSPVGILDRLAEEWKPDRFLLVDCFTDGLGRGEATFTRFYRSRRAKGVRVERIADPGDPEPVQARLAEIEREQGFGTRYVFDSLTGMQELWGPDAALSFFLRSCPRLYDLGTVAYWLMERGAHAGSFRSRIAHVTQLVLDVRSVDEGHAVKVLKASGRPPDVLGREAQVAFDGARVRLVREREGTRERTGEVLRAHRVARGISQAEFARRIGISPSALSQAERGTAGLSGDTLTRAFEALGLPFGAVERPTSGPYQLARRGARLIEARSPGVTSEQVARSRGGGEIHMLTLAPSSRWLKPPFATKREEVLVVVAGLLEVRVGGTGETLQAGDSMALSSEPLSAWRNPGPEEARVLWALFP